MRRKQKGPELLGAALHCLSSFSCDQFQLYLVLHVASAGWEMESSKKMSRTAGRDLDIQRDLERENTHVTLMSPSKVNDMVLYLYLSKPQYQYR